MKIKREKVDNPTQLNIESIEIHNDNNFSFKFYTYGGYIHEVKIPINKQEDKTEDDLETYLSVKYGVLNIKGLMVIQELIKENNELKKRLNKIEQILNIN